MRKFALSLVLGVIVSFVATSSAQSTPPGSSVQPTPQSSSASQTAQNKSAQDTQDKTAEKDDPLISFLTVLSHSTEEQGIENQMSVGFQFTEIYDSNPLNVLRGPRADEISNLNGSFGINRKWQHTSIAGNYNGGADYYHRLDKQDQMYHEASAAQSFFGGPVTFLVGGDYEMLPSSSFGFDATHLISSGSVDLINSDLLPNQSIQTRPLERMSYTGVSQLGLQIGAHSELDFSGSYGRLRYEKNGIPGTNQASGGSAYSYAFTSRDKIGLSYQYELFQTSGNPLEIIDQVVLASYGHRFASNLALKVGAGPDLRSYNNTRAKALQGVDPAVAANASLNYSGRSTRLSVAYSRSTTSGQGILQGSESDQIQFSVSQRIGRSWALGGTAGYARSASIARVVQGSTSQLVDQAFNSGYYSTSLSKKIGVLSFILGYTLETQNSTAPLCSTGLCQDYPLHHVVAVSLAFNPKPVRLE